MKLTAKKAPAALAAAVGVAGLIAGCASAGGSARGQAGTSTAPGTASSTTSSAPGASPTAPGGSQATPHVAGVPACLTTGLKLTRGENLGAAAGSSYTQIDLTNASGATCTLYGFPGVALTTSTAPGSQVGAAATRSASKPAAVVTLRPGEAAVAQVQLVDVLNYPAANCDPASASYLQVYPPGQTLPLYLSFSARGCVKPVFTLGVTVMYPQAAG